ncbi:MAG TPA: beta-propeller fold lactonase family protein [Methylocella sp.]|nr:beta-propeller fold lactonase family protein [Methylocella sp.]
MQKAISFFHKALRTFRAGTTLAAVATAPSLIAQSAFAWDNFVRPTYSSPIAISADNRFVWSVNPADNTVSVIRTDTNALIKNIPVGKEPQGVTLDPDNRYAYVANAADSTVTIIRIENSYPTDKFMAEVYRTLKTGAEPWNIVTSPDGKRVFVANSSQDTVTVIDAKEQEIIGNVNIRRSLCNDPDRNRHFQPRGLGVTQDSKKLYVTRFLSFIQPNGVQGVDTGREGLVCRLDIDTSSFEIKDYSPAAVITLAPQITGFEFPVNSGVNTLAFPNQLQSIVIRGNQAYLPNVAASPSDPLQFRVDTEAYLNIIDDVNGNSQTDASLTKFFLGSSNLGPNLHLGARTPETGKPTIFFANPWGIAFTNQTGPGAAYVVAAASDLLVKVLVAADGTISFTGGPMTTHVIDLNDPTNPATSGAGAGKNPQGIVINSIGTTAYVANFVSRNVSVVNLITDQVSTVVQTTALPAPGSEGEVVLVGAEQFFSSRGHYNQPSGTTISIDERLAQVGWQACSSCHFKGFSDSVVWTFNTGPRKSVPLNGTFDPQGRTQATSNQRVLNYSAIFDEVHDFDANVRNVSGPGNLAAAQTCSDPPPATSLFDPNHGLLLGDTNAQLAPCTINAFLKPNEGRNEITVTLPGSTVPVRALSALNEWVRVAIRTPNGPLTDKEIKGGISSDDVEDGRELFVEAGCGTCHGGNQWTSSIRDFTPPPNINDIFCETSTGTGSPPGCLTAAVIGNPVNNQYLARFLRDIKSFNLNVQGSGNAIPGEPLIGAVEKATRVLVNGVLQAAPQDALGFDYNQDGKGNGFSPPSLLGIFAFPPYYHNGACETLACVLADENHRTAGNQTDVLADAKDQAKVVTFLESLDAATKPVK